MSSLYSYPGQQSAQQPLQGGQSGAVRAVRSGSIVVQSGPVQPACVPSSCSLGEAPKVEPATLKNHPDFTQLSGSPTPLATARATGLTSKSLPNVSCMNAQACRAGSPRLSLMIAASASKQELQSRSDTKPSPKCRFGEPLLALPGSVECPRSAQSGTKSPAHGSGLALDASAHGANGPCELPLRTADPGAEECLRSLECGSADCAAGVEVPCPARLEHREAEPGSIVSDAVVAQGVDVVSSERDVHALRQELEAEIAARRKACEHLEALLIESRGQVRALEDVSQDRSAHDSEMHIVNQELAKFCGQLGRELRCAMTSQPHDRLGEHPGGAGCRAESLAELSAVLKELFCQGQQTQQRMEELLQVRVQAATEELRSLLRREVHDHQELQRQHREALDQEVQEREEISHMLLTYLEDKIQEERQRCDERLQGEQQRWDERLQETQQHWDEKLHRELQRCQQDLSQHRQALQKVLQEGLEEERKHREEGLCASEAHLSAMLGRVEEHSGQELLTARQAILQNILELRDELTKGLRIEMEERVQADQRIQEAAGQPAASMEAADGTLAIAQRTLEEQHGKLRTKVDGHEARLGTLQNEVYRELEKTASQSHEVLCFLNSTRKEVTGLRDGLEQLHERVGQSSGLSAQRSCPGPGAAEAARGSKGEGGKPGDRGPAPAAREAEAGALRELQAALEVEAKLREEADDRLLSHTRELVREERQGREQGQHALELGVQSVKELLFVDSGKREEHDRDIQMQLSKIDEDMEAVKRQLTLRNR